MRNCHNATNAFKNVTVTDDRKILTVTQSDGKLASFHSKWLRFNCQCNKCLDVNTNYRIWPAHEIPLNLTINNAKTIEDGSIHVQWNEEEHEGILTKKHLLQHSYSEENRRRLREETELQFQTDMTIPKISWRDVESSEEYLYRWLRYISDQGICLLTDVPAEHHFARNVLSRIGFLMATFYGELWDVKVEEKMVNSTDGNQALLFHMDQAIYESQPGIQFLHCLKFDDTLEGGETLFVDLYHIAEMFRMDYPEKFRILTEIPVTFRRIHYKRSNPVHMVYRRPLISLNDENRVINITWHEHQFGPPLVKENNVDEFYLAYQLFARAIKEFPYRRAVRLRKGDMICFNNRRLAHARNAFTGEGERHLQGCYVNSEDFKSKLMYLSLMLDDGRPVCHLGNTDWR
ncbi:gamma-butyrobetaine dioxygenase-like [Argopecten irradians]|uniref:gamma-butyrobetaine dioxygenase-like n=1 Tax=Argopecten irradians TaxID=31199 RepID=UPI0037133EF0